jgi:hypothetical protein
MRSSEGSAGGPISVKSGSGSGLCHSRLAASTWLAAAEEAEEAAAALWAAGGSTWSSAMGWWLRREL